MFSKKPVVCSVLVSVLFSVTCLSGCARPGIPTESPLRSQISPSVTATKSSPSGKMYIDTVPDKGPEEVFAEFTWMLSALERYHLDELTLSIYYLDPSIELRAPYSVDRLKASSIAGKVVVNEAVIKANIDALKQLSVTDFAPVEASRVYFNVRFYYVFESSKYGPIFEYAEVVHTELRGGDYCALINGVAFEFNYAFIQMVKPFLPDDARVHF